MKNKIIYPTKLQRSWTLFLLVMLTEVSIPSFAQAPDWLWAKGMGGTNDDQGNSVVIDASGNVYTTGWFSGTADFDPGAGTFNLTSAGAYDIFISKLDSAGNFVWAKGIGGTGWDNGSAIYLDASGNVYTTGYFYGTVDFDPGAGIFYLTVGVGFISKLDSSGNFVWAKDIGGGGSSIALDHANGNVYTTGVLWGTVDFDPGAGVFNLTSAGLQDIFISKLDSSGNFVWAKRMGGPSNDYGRSIALDPTGSGDVYTTGSFRGTVDFDPGVGTFNLTSAFSDPDIFISKLDSSGNFVWAKRMGGGICYSIAIDPAGSGALYTTGAFQGIPDFDPGAGVFNLTSSGLYDIFISRLDGSGNFVWAKAMGGTNHDYGYSIAIDPAGSGALYTTGFFLGTSDFDPGAGVFNLTSAGGLDIFISKLDSSGNFIWAKAMGGANQDVGYSLALDVSNNVYVAGEFYSPSITFGSITLTNADSTVSTADIFIAKLDTAMTIGISEAENSTSSISVFPNPAGKELRIQDSGFRIAGVEVYDVLGEKRLTLTLSKGEGLRVDVSSLAPGIYFVKVRSEKEERVVKFVKQ